MIAAFMLYGVSVAALLGLMCLAAERSFRLHGHPGRWVWVAAAVGTLIIPELTVVAPGIGAWPVQVAGAGLSDSGLGALASSLARLDGVLALGWFIGSAIVLAGLIASALRLAYARRRWRRAHIADTPVLVSRALRMNTE